MSLKIEVITNETINNEQKAQTFETFRYGLLENPGNIFSGNSSALDLRIFNTSIQNLNTPHVMSKEHQNQNFLGDDKDENIFVLHLNIRSINKDCGNFKMFLSNKNFSFSIICFSEIWLNDSNVD